MIQSCQASAPAVEKKLWARGSQSKRSNKPLFLGLSFCFDFIFCFVIAIPDFLFPFFFFRERTFSQAGVEVERIWEGLGEEKEYDQNKLYKEF